MTTVTRLVYRRDLKDKEPYEWPQPAYQLLEAMKKKLGISMAMQIQTYLQGDAEKLYLPPDQEKLFRTAAAEHHVQL